MPAVQFWFEFASTYSYLAAHRIERAAAAAGVPIEWKAFLLGPLFRRQGWENSPFVLNPARGRYMWRDVERTCARYDAPFRRPSVFPRASLLAARVAILGEGEAWLPEFARGVYRANFAEDRDISDPAVIEAILTKAGQDGPSLLGRAVEPENKERLRRQTDRAWEIGIFGAPTFVVGDEIFWGNDRMEDAFEWYAAREGKGA